MRKSIIMMVALCAFSACKQQSEVVEVDHLQVTESADSTVSKDTISEVATQGTEDIEVIAETEKVNPEKSTSAVTQKAALKYAAFGTTITADAAISKEQMTKKYAALKKGDTINVKFKSKISSVCKKKGCWMKMDLADDKESFIRFKDYGFFVPLNADNTDAVVSGKAFIDVISVDELKHYAKDGGQSASEIEKITQPKITYAFEADGVLIQQ